MNMTKWFKFYSFDVMGDVAFGKSYKMLGSGQKHWSLQLLSEGKGPIGFNFPTRFLRILIAIPGATAGYHKFANYCCKQLDERMKVDKVENLDIIAALLEHHRKNPAPERAVEMPMLQADSRLIIVARSDATAARLVHLFYHLARDQSLAQGLREDVKPLTENGSSIYAADLADAKLLNGIINETLRLYPPVPSGVFRKTPPEGIHVKDTFVPSDTTIRMPGWATAKGEIYDLSVSIPTAGQNPVTTRIFILTARPLSPSVGIPVLK
jgi:cytochrome P450